MEEFERGIEHAKMETAKAEESRLQMEQSLRDAEDQIVCLRASRQLEKSKLSSLERQTSNYTIQVEELKSGHDKNAEKLLKELSDLKARNQELEANMAQCESEKNSLKEQQEQGHAAVDQKRKRMEEERAIMTENHIIELQNVKNEAKRYKESKEEMEAMHKEMKAELECNSQELQALTTRSNQESDGKLLGRVLELVQMNSVLTGQLVTASAENQSSRDEIGTLKSEMAALSDEKLKVEWKLARRQKFKGRLSGMTESLKDDLVQLSYQKEY